jgi:hypothetical protein
MPTCARTVPNEHARKTNPLHPVSPGQGRVQGNPRYLYATDKQPGTCDLREVQTIEGLPMSAPKMKVYVVLACLPDGAKKIDSIFTESFQAGIQQHMRLIFGDAGVAYTYIIEEWEVN